MGSPGWTAPTATRAVDALVRVPGSKSATNRALILGALASGPSTITGALDARDTSLMAAALRSLGTGVTSETTDRGLTIRMTPAELAGPTQVDVGLAGTVMRFVPPVAALAHGDARFDGDPRARVRPMAAIIDALESLGVAIDDDGRRTLPFIVRGRGHVPGGAVALDASASSQFVSGLLLSAARFDDTTTVRHLGGALPSLPHIDMTTAMLEEHGVHVTRTGSDATDLSWTVAPQEIRAIDRLIEPDLSNAAAFLAAALVTGGCVMVPDWPALTTQAGDRLRQILASMGADVELTAAGLRVSGTGTISGVDLDLRDVGELTPVIAALCALADGPSRLRGIAHLRGHETDRLAALAHEIAGLGGRATETEDGLVIEPSTLHGGSFAAYDDHRMAMAGAVIGLAVPGVVVDDVTATTKTLPDFAGMWARMLAGDA